MNKKSFNCVEFQHRAQLGIYEQIRGMSHEQERAYFQEQAEKGPLGDWWKRVKTANKHHRSR